jgi:iron complex outermembrane receptor protein
MLLRGDLTHVSAQRDVAQNELPTDAYTMLNAYANWRIRSGSVAWDLFARANNLLNQEARNHTSLIKDIAPLGARSLMVGVRAIF